MKSNLPDNRKKYFSESALLIATLFWSGTFVIVKVSLQDISSMLFIGLRFLIATVFLVPFAIKYKHEFSGKAIYAGSLLGLFFFLGFATQTVGLKFTTATNSAFITGSSVVMVPVLQTLLEKRPPTKGSITGIIFVFFGILFLSSGGNSIFTFLSDFTSNFNAGDFFTLMCAIFFAMYVVYLDIVTNRFGFVAILFMQMFVTAVAAFAASSFFDLIDIEKARIEYTNYLIFGILYTSIFATLITTAIITKYQKDVTPTKAAIVYSLEPIFAAILAFFLLNEKISNFGILGAVLVFSGLLISETYEYFTNGRKKVKS